MTPVVDVKNKRNRRIVVLNNVQDVPLLETLQASDTAKPKTIM